MNNINNNKKELLPEQHKDFLKTLKSRFEKNLPCRQAGMSRHKGLVWAKAQERLEAHTEKLWSLSEMERTGGEPDVVGYDKKTDEYIFYDCCAESPQRRRSLCYHRAAPSLPIAAIITSSCIITELTRTMPLGGFAARSRSK